VAEVMYRARVGNGLAQKKMLMQPFFGVRYSLHCQANMSKKALITLFQMQPSHR
jgi:hypothetical protein